MAEQPGVFAMRTGNRMSRDEAQRLIASVKWFHSFELLPGVRTPGSIWHDAGGIFDSLGVPKDLSALNCLDIGAWDGPTAFEMEARGGRVVAIDIQDPDETAFNTAKRILGSSVEYVQASVYDLDRVIGDRKFDIVAFFGVYYHLKYPILAFENISRRMSLGGSLFISGEILRNYAETLDGRPISSVDATALAESDLPLVLSYPGRYKNASNWHVPNLSCIKSWLAAAGFQLQQHYIIEDLLSDGKRAQALRARATKIGDPIEEHPLVGSTMWRREKQPDVKSHVEQPRPTCQPVFQHVKEAQFADTISLAQGIEVLQGCVAVNPDGTGFGKGLLYVEVIQPGQEDRLQIKPGHDITTKGRDVFFRENFIGRLDDVAAGPNIIRVSFAPNVFFEGVSALLRTITLSSPCPDAGVRKIRINLTDADDDTAVTEIVLEIDAK